jgi:hypothetical protein
MKDFQLAKNDMQFIATTFLSSDKSQLGVFWLSEDGSEVIHSRTVQEEDINPNDSHQYEFLHADEWHNHPPEFEKAYTSYPRGRIEFNHGKYNVEISSILLDDSIKSMVRHYFNLPSDTTFVVGLWRHE